MRGRFPSGPEYVDHLEGSAQAKERLREVLQTLAGSHRVQEACQLLGICEQRFDQLRRQALRQLESKPGGRPRREPVVLAEEALALRQQVADLESELRAAQVREEIALVLPRAIREPEGKKTRTRKLRQAHPA
jgi:hypothetical protein